MTPGTVVRVYSSIAGKQKYHLCISVSGGFLFLNTPKKPYPGDLLVPCSEIPFLEPTDSGESVICCATLLKLGRSDLRKATVVGQVSKSVLQKIMDFVDGAEFLSDEDREFILDGLDGWVA